MRFSVLMVTLAAILAGCAAGKKASPGEDKLFSAPARTVREGSADWWYKNHYLWWRAWEDEAIAYLGVNELRVKESLRRALENLQKMKAALCPEKQEEVTPGIEELKKLLTRVESENLSPVQRNRLGTELRNHRGMVERNFSYEKVEMWLVRNRPKETEPATKP